MSRWTALNTSRWIARADVQSGIDNGHLLPIAGAPSIGTEQFLTRAEMEAWVSCTGTGASNQWQIKSGSSFTNPLPYSHTIKYPGDSNIWTTSSAACNEVWAAYNYTVYSACSTLTNGCKFYGLTSGDYWQWLDMGDWPNDWYKLSSGEVFQLNSSGEIENLQSCSVTVDINNQTTTGFTINSVRINGTTVYYGTLYPGQTANVSYGSTGTFTVEVDYTDDGTSSYKAVNVRGSDLYSVCQDATLGVTGTLTYVNTVVNFSNWVIITVQDGTC